MSKPQSSSSMDKFQTWSTGVIGLVLICLALIWSQISRTPPKPAPASNDNAPEVTGNSIGPTDPANVRPGSNRVPQEDEPTLPGFVSEDATDGGTVSTPVSNSERTRGSEPNALLIPDQTIRDQRGRVVFRGTIDLKPTVDRIERHESNRHRNDGTTFQNREGRLPRKPAGYYQEYVHPTPGESGPGPQRLIVGRNGDLWYTPDHYHSFRQVKKEGEREP